MRHRWKFLESGDESCGRCEKFCFYFLACFGLTLGMPRLPNAIDTTYVTAAGTSTSTPTWGCVVWGFTFGLCSTRSVAETATATCMRDVAGDSAIITCSTRSAAKSAFVGEALTDGATHSQKCLSVFWVDLAIGQRRKSRTIAYPLRNRAYWCCARARGDHIACAFGTAHAGQAGGAQKRIGAIAALTWTSLSAVGIGAWGTALGYSSAWHGTFTGSA